MILGHLYGNLEHNLSEPVYRFDRYYTDNVEYGMQFLFKNRYIKNDLWANWEKFIFSNDPYREEFVTGNAFNAKIDISGKLTVNFPFHFTWTHAGGQIYEHKPLRENIMSLYNTMAGISFKYTNISSPEEQNFNRMYLKNVSLEYNYNKYKAGANPPPGDEFHQPYSNGFGSYIRCNIDFNALKTMIGYWGSETFIAPRGEEIFLSAFGYDNKIIVPKVELINFKIAYDRRISEDINLSFRTDLYYNLQLKSLFYSYGIYFVYNDIFPIRRFSIHLL